MLKWVGYLCVPKALTWRLGTNGNKLRMYLKFEVYMRCFRLDNKSVMVQICLFFCIPNLCSSCGLWPFELPCIGPTSPAPCTPEINKWNSSIKFFILLNNESAREQNLYFAFCTDPNCHMTYTFVDILTNTLF